MEKEIYSVCQVNRYIHGLFREDLLLSSLYVKGEVSNCKYHSSGHLYFSIKDESATLSCVMFRGDRKGLAFPMKDGDKVVCLGAVDTYERSGTYQLYVREIRLEGAGILYERFLKMKQKLEEMGMFDPRYKLPIKKYNRTIGIVTAPTGAAIRDIENIAHRRNPFVQLYLYPALVQGEGAKESIVKGIRALDRLGLDVIIVGRGGGSIEDLWAFNEEEVARAIFECGTPVISAVGHETDTTIADFAADLRAPTPSAAAELAVFDEHEFRERVTQIRSALTSSMSRKVLRIKEKQTQYRVRLGYLSPQNMLREKRRRASELDEALRENFTEKIAGARNQSEDFKEKMTRGMAEKHRTAGQRLRILVERFRGLNPLEKLRQGFSYVEGTAGTAVRSVLQADIGEKLIIHVTDGTIESTVDRTHPAKGD